ncbi:Alba DNA/RNA-binding protein [Zea mays]|uniref:Alba DNA/RNA-binding protein n=1 Tax=Zea mays TaxID=4577 RepID=A0A1D6MK40_MAIZE|nr:Alba DNA/RNA-binding protein [Zea mays]
MVVEEIAEGVKNLTVTGDAAASGGEGQRRGGGGSSNRIQVSNTKKPLFFYVNLAKSVQRYMQQHGDVELSALGMAIATVVTVAEILKNNGFAVEKKIRTSTVEINDESRGRPFQKAKIEIILGKSDKFDELMAAAAEERGEVEDGEEQA